jgi:hypothetical protein
MKIMLGRASRDFLVEAGCDSMFADAFLPLKKIVEVVASPPRNFRRVSFISEYYNAILALQMGRGVRSPTVREGKNKPQMRG